MTQEEAATVLESQQYRFDEGGVDTTVFGLTALVEYTRTRLGLPADDMRPCLVAIAEFVRLGAAAMPEDATMRAAVVGIIEFTSKAAA